MTRIIVTPIDMSAPGSYRKRKQVLKVAAEFQAALTSDNVMALNRAMDQIEAIVLSYAETEDGTPLDAALEDASADDFDALLLAILGNGETVPNVTSTS